MSLAGRLNAQPWMARVEKASASDLAEIDRILAQGDAATKKIRAAFLDAIRKAAADVDTGQIIRLLRAGRIGEAIAVVDAQSLAAAFERVSQTIAQSVIAAGVAAANAARVPAAVEFGFGVTNPATVAYLQSNEFSLIRELTAEARAAVAETIRAGVEAGRNPIDVARDVRAHIGLTARQARAVANFRKALENRQADALDRALRDKRFDATIARAIRDQTPLKRAQIDKMVARYEARYLKYRSEVIGRTEGLRAANAGGHLAWVNAVQSGKIEADQVVRKWINTGDHKVRHSHRMIPRMNEKGVGLFEHFQSPLGPILMPGDPNATAANTIQCFTGDVVPTFISGAVRLMRRAYSGPLLTLRLENGAVLSVTPNHPIETDAGRVAAGDLVEGDDLIYCATPNGGAFRDANPDARPPSFAQMFDLARIVFGSERVAGGRPQFHGDGSESDVDIVAPNGQLMDWLKTACAQGGQNLNLTAADVRDHLLSGDSDGAYIFVTSFLAADGVVGAPSERGSFFRAGLRHAAGHAFRAVRRCNAVFTKASSNLRALLAERSGDRFYALAGGVARDNDLGWDTVPSRVREIVSPPDALAGADKLQSPGIIGPTEPCYDLHQGRAVTVSLQRIVEIVRNDEFSGHVYNSETQGGAYLANGVLSGNCRCVVIQRFKYRPSVAAP